MCVYPLLFLPPLPFDGQKKNRTPHMKKTSFFLLYTYKCIDLILFFNMAFVTFFFSFMSLGNKWTQEIYIEIFSDYMFYSDVLLFLYSKKKETTKTLP